MMPNNSHTRSLFFALGMHLILLSALSWQFISPRELAVAPMQITEVDIVHAVAVEQHPAVQPVAQLPPQQDQEAITQRERQAAELMQQRKEEQQRLEETRRAIAEERREQQARRQAEQAAQLEIAKQQKLIKEQQAKAAAEKKRAQAQVEQQHKEQLRVAEQAAKARAAAIAKQKSIEAAEQAAMMDDLANAQEARLQRQAQMEKYNAQIVQAIARQWILPEHVDKSRMCRFEIRLGPGGVVLAAKLISSSLDPVLDRSAQAAIFKASPLPVPTEPDLFDKFRIFNLTVRPERVLSAG